MIDHQERREDYHASVRYFARIAKRKPKSRIMQLIRALGILAGFIVIFLIGCVIALSFVMFVLDIIATYIY